MPTTTKPKTPPKRYTREQVVAQIRSTVDTDYAGNQAAAARDCYGCHDSYLSEILSGTRKPGPMILKVLGLKRVRSTHYEVAPSVRVSVRGD